MPVGAGAIPGDVGGVEVEVTYEDLRAAEEPMASVAADIREIADRYIQPTFIEPITQTLAIGQSAKVDLSETTINSFILCVVTAQIDLWFGDFTSGTPAGAHGRFFAGFPPSQHALPPKGYVFTFRNSGIADATFTFIPMAI